MHEAVVGSDLTVHPDDSGLIDSTEGGCEKINVREAFNLFRIGSMGEE
jgi:hypothetical protein